MGVGPGPNVVEGYYAGDARRRGARRDPGVGDDAGATVENSTVVAGRETRATESGTLGIIADSDGGSQSIIYAPYEAEKKEARAVELKPATGAAAALQKIANDYAKREKWFPATETHHHAGAAKTLDGNFTSRRSRNERKGRRVREKGFRA